MYYPFISANYSPFEQEFKSYQKQSKPIMIVLKDKFKCLSIQSQKYKMVIPLFLNKKYQNLKEASLQKYLCKLYMLACCIVTHKNHICSRKYFTIPMSIYKFSAWLNFFFLNLTFRPFNFFFPIYFTPKKQLSIDNMFGLNAIKVYKANRVSSLIRWQSKLN